MKGIRVFLTGIVFLAALTGICRADKAVDLVEENAQLKQRVDKLEKEVEELKKLMMQQAPKVVEPVITPPVAAKPAEPNVAMPLKLSEADMRKILAMLEKEAAKKKAAWADVDIQFYGTLRVDASYDSSRMDEGNFAKWVIQEKTNKNDNEFNMSAKQSRLGLKVSGPDDGITKTSGQLEIDFFGNGEENKANPRMRHAFMKVEWPQSRFEILAGQTWDVISPLYPCTLNDTVMWWTGNIGFRRPQLRFTKSTALSKDIDLKLEGAFARTIGTAGQFTPGDSGEDSGIPNLQARASVSFPWFGHKLTVVGISGHWGREEFDINNRGDNKDFRTWSGNLDVTQPVNKWLTIKGEAFTGENLTAFLGGIGQGLRNTGTASSPILDREIGSKGGWLAAELGPWNKWRFNVGTGVDSVDRDDVTADGRTYNHSVFGNVLYSINKNTEIGFELSHWRTRYKGPGDADSVRAQTAFIYKF